MRSLMSISDWGKYVDISNRAARAVRRADSLIAVDFATTIAIALAYRPLKSAGSTVKINLIRYRPEMRRA